MVVLVKYFFYATRAIILAPTVPSGIFFFFLSDSGPRDAVANTLYRGENENLCVWVCLVAVVVVAAS